VHKTVLVGLREFRQRVRKRGFLLTTIGTPLILIVIWSVTGVFDTSPTSEQPLNPLSQADQPVKTVGYVDQAGLVRSIPDPVPSDLYRSFSDITAANKALERGDIAAFYVIPSDYRETGSVRRVSRGLPTAPPNDRLFEWVLVVNLFPDADPQRIARWRWPFNDTGPVFETLSPQGEQEARGNTMLPFLVTVAVMVPLFTSGSYLFQSLAQEKSNRVMEILLVSLQPRQLLSGKLLGLGALTLVQYLMWGLIALLGVAAVGQNASQLLSGVSLSRTELLLVVPYALGGFLLYAALMAGIGALSPDVEGSRAWVFIVGLPMMIPIYLWSAIAASPNGALATVLSLIPFSAPVAMLMRMTTTIVPVWQIGASLLLLLLGGVGVVLLMARLFRAQTLLSGESFTLKRLWSALTG
jgi:ABC-2 type transport system permease protein